MKAASIAATLVGVTGMLAPALAAEIEMPYNFEALKDNAWSQYDREHGKHLKDTLEHEKQAGLFDPKKDITEIAKENGMGDFSDFDRLDKRDNYPRPKELSIPPSPFDGGHRNMPHVGSPKLHGNPFKLHGSQHLHNAQKEAYVGKSDEFIHYKRPFGSKPNGPDLYAEGMKDAWTEAHIPYHDTLKNDERVDGSGRTRPVDWNRLTSSSDWSNVLKSGHPRLARREDLDQAIEDELKELLPDTPILHWRRDEVDLNVSDVDVDDDEDAMIPGELNRCVVIPDFALFKQFVPIYVWSLVIERDHDYDNDCGQSFKSAFERKCGRVFKFDCDRIDPLLYGTSRAVPAGTAWIRFATRRRCSYVDATHAIYTASHQKIENLQCMEITVPKGKDYHWVTDLDNLKDREKKADKEVKVYQYTTGADVKQKAALHKYKAANPNATEDDLTREGLRARLHYLWKNNVRINDNGAWVVPQSEYDGFLQFKRLDAARKEAEFRAQFVAEHPAHKGTRDAPPADPLLTADDAWNVHLRQEQDADRARKTEELRATKARLLAKPLLRANPQIRDRLLQVQWKEENPNWDRYAKWDDYPWGKPEDILSV